jgi:alpha-tubulin suppressor-like RCC1 family protein
LRKRFINFFNILIVVCFFLLIPFLIFSQNQQPEIIDISAGWSFSLALMSDGSVFSWGSNGNGELGIGTIDYKDIHSVPKKIPYLSNIIAIAAGKDHALALDKNGIVWAWGNNYFGQLGNGEIKNKFPYGEPVPSKVKGLSEIISIAAGEGFSMALKSDGTLFSWGLNTDGQLGIDTKNLKNPNISPLPLKVEIPEVKSISAGIKHSLVLDKNGSVWSFGSDSRGQLGDGRGGIYFNRKLPYKIPNLTDVEMISAGHSMSIFLKKDGTVWATGLFNTEAEIFSIFPTKVSELPPVKKIFCGPAAMHILVLAEDGSVWVWGLNTSGQLGDGSVNKIGYVIKGRGKYPPFKLPFLKNISRAALGGNHTLVLTEDKTILSWGNNWCCQLGIGKKSHYELKPQKVKFSK